MADMTLLSDALTTYVHDHTSAEHPLFLELRERTYATLGDPQMQIGRVEGRQRLRCSRVHLWEP